MNNKRAATTSVDRLKQTQGSAPKRSRQGRYDAAGESDSSEEESGNESDPESDHDTDTASESDQESEDDEEDDRRMLERARAAKQAKLARLEAEAAATYLAQVAAAAESEDPVQQNLTRIPAAAVQPERASDETSAQLQLQLAFAHSIACLVPHIKVTEERFGIPVGPGRGPRDAPLLVAQLFLLCQDCGLSDMNNMSARRVEALHKIKLAVIERIATCAFARDLAVLRQHHPGQDIRALAELTAEFERQKAMMESAKEYARQCMSLSCTDIGGNIVAAGLNWWSSPASAWVKTAAENDPNSAKLKLYLSDLYSMVRRDTGDLRYEQLGFSELERGIQAQVTALQLNELQTSADYVELQRRMAADWVPDLEHVQALVTLHTAANGGEINQLQQFLSNHNPRDDHDPTRTAAVSECKQRLSTAVVQIRAEIIAYLDRFWGQFMSLGKACMVQELRKRRGSSVDSNDSCTPQCEIKFQGTVDFARIYEYMNVLMPGDPLEPRAHGMSQASDDQGRQLINLAKLWLKHPNSRKFAGIKFDPSGEAVHLRDLPVASTASQDCNLWRGFSITKKMAVAYAQNLVTEADPTGQQACERLAQPFLRHILDIWCCGNQTHFDYVMRWFGTILQLRKQNSTALVLKSQQGAGKGIIFDKIGGEIIGADHYFDCHDIEDAIGTYTNQMRGKLLVFLDEVTWGGNRQMGDRLKKLITQSTQRFSAKYEPTMTIESFANIAMAGNNEWIAPIDANQRRMFMLALSDQYSGRQTPDSKAYFDAILAVPAPAVAFLLYHVSLDGFNAREFESTDLERDQQARSFDTVHHWWDACLSEGLIEGAIVHEEAAAAADGPGQIIAAVDDATVPVVDIDPSQPWGRLCVKESIYKSYVTFSEAIRRAAFQVKPPNEFWKVMMAMTTVAIDAGAAPLDDGTVMMAPAFNKPLKRVMRVGAQRQVVRLVRMPSLQQCRQGWRNNVVLHEEWDAHRDL